MHGALWVALKTEGEVQARARAMAKWLRWAVGAMAALVLGLSARVQPRAIRGAWLLPLALIALVVAGWVAKGDRARFLASCGYIVAMLVGAVLGVYPNVLPSEWGSAIELDDLQRGGGALRAIDRTAMVHSRHHPGCGIFLLRLSRVQRQGAGGRGGLLMFTAVTPMLKVNDLAETIEFTGTLGFNVENRWKGWCMLRGGRRADVL